MITNQKLELYNEAAADVLNSSKRNGRSRVKLLAASRQAALETIAQSDDGLHLPESTRNVVSIVILLCDIITDCLAAQLFFLFLTVNVGRILLTILYNSPSRGPWCS